MNSKLFPSSRLEGRGLACRRGGRQVFSGLDFTLEAGAGLVLQGSNGSGKSTLLRLMAGLLRPSAGDLSWGGRPVHDDPAAHAAQLHFMGHKTGVKPVLTVLENVAFRAALYGAPKAAAERACDALALDTIRDLPARYLSSGQERRTALAALLAAPLPLWLLDEPTVGLDSESLAALAAAMAAHRAMGGIVVVASHVETGLESPDVLTLSSGKSVAAAGEEAWP